MEQTAKHPTDRSAALARQNEELKKNLRKPLSSTRIELCQKIKFKFPHFQGFLTQYSSNLSMTGMFVQSEKFEPPGTLVAFEFLLPDKVKLIQGQAEVVWVRQKSEGPDRPAGMGLRFVRLDAESRRLIRWTVEKHVLEGGTLVELEDLMGPGKHGLNGRDVDLRKLYPYAGAGRAKSTGRRYGTLAAAAAVAAVLLIGGFLYAAWQSGGASAARAAAGSPPAGAETEAEKLEEQLPAEEELFAAVEAWAGAWSEQRVGDYLDSYSPDFEPPRGMSRVEWEALRSSRISKPRHISIDIKELDADVLSPRRARVAFLQRYESDSYQDFARKTLELALESGRWRIVDERSEEIPGR